MIMKEMMPKDFIKTVLINEVGEIASTHPYISFATMAIGIEFLGKCLNSQEKWNTTGQSKDDFELAVNRLNSLSPYRPLLLNNKLWDSLRNGFSHSFVPKTPITLSSKDEAEHLVETKPGRMNLKCENFYEDFKNACQEVIDMHFNSGKMTKPLIEVPDTNSTTTPNNQSSVQINNIQTSGSTNN